MRFLLVNKSSALKVQDLVGIAAGFQIMQHAFCVGWNVSPMQVAVLTPQHAPMPGDVVADFVDKDEGDGTLAFHFDDQGRPAIEVDVQSVLRYGGGILDDAGTGLSVSAAFQHEAFETRIDPYANAFVQRADGTWVALEVGDPVEAFPRYADVPGVGRVHGCDAVLPPYFAEDGVGPYSLTGECKAPFENDGYLITLGADGQPNAKRTILLAGDKYTPNLLAYRKHRIETGRGRGSYIVAAAA